MQRQECINTIPALAPSPRIGWRSWAAQGISLIKRDTMALVALYLAWDSRARSRQALKDMDAHQLRDVGLGADDVRKELTKPFWRD